MSNQESTNSNLDALEQQEILAFLVFATSEQTDLDSLTQGINLEEVWRSNPDIRKQWRAYAELLHYKMCEEAGLRVTVGNSKKGKKFLKSLVTIPEREAYRLGSE
jgi:hypothetical protein